MRRGTLSQTPSQMNSNFTSDEWKVYQHYHYKDGRPYSGNCMLG